MKITTIINDGKLVGYIKLQESVLEDLQKNEVLILTQEINRGDSTITIFKLTKYTVKEA